MIRMMKRATRIVREGSEESERGSMMMSVMAMILVESRGAGQSHRATITPDAAIVIETTRPALHVLIASEAATDTGAAIDHHHATVSEAWTAMSTSLRVVRVNLNGIIATTNTTTTSRQRTRLVADLRATMYMSTRSKIVPTARQDMDVPRETSALANVIVRSIDRFSRSHRTTSASRSRVPSLHH
jgi:hypothetical protein